MTEMRDLIADMTRLSALLDKGLDALRQYAREFAEADSAYREAKARAYLASDGRTVDAKKADVDIACTKERLAQRIADGMRLAAVEAVRSRRAQISALQSIANAVKAEAEMSRTGPL